MEGEAVEINQSLAAGTSGVGVLHFSGHPTRSLAGPQDRPAPERGYGFDGAVFFVQFGFEDADGSGRQEILVGGGDRSEPSHLGKMASFSSREADSGGLVRRARVAFEGWSKFGLFEIIFAVSAASAQ